MQQLQSRRNGSHSYVHVYTIHTTHFHFHHHALWERGYISTYILSLRSQLILRITPMVSDIVLVSNIDDVLQSHTRSSMGPQQVKNIKA